MTAIPLDQVEAFLKAAPPFCGLPDEARARLAPRLLMEYFPKGETFIRAGETPLQFLYLVSKGALKLFTRNGRQEVTLDLRSEYDGVGLTTLAAGGLADFNVKAEEDSICYLVPREVVLELAETYPRFRAWAFDLLRALQSAPDDPDPEAPGGEEAMFLTPVSRLLQRPAVSSGPELNIRSAAALMQEEKIGSLVVVDPDRRPLGLITNRDIRALVARGEGLDGPVSSIMQSPVESVQLQASCFEALMLMTKRNIHHLPVLDKWTLKGVVTQHDLLLLQGVNPVSVVRNIENAPAASRLAQVRQNVDRLLEVLVRQRFSAAGIQDVITMIDDRLMRRLIEIAMAQLASHGRGAPPVPWAWVALGRAGRKEQIPGTGPGCGIVFDDCSETGEQAAREYFLDLAGLVIEGLVECGLAMDPAQNLANNPRWCQPVSAWQNYFRQLIRDTDGERLKSAVPIFDGRFLFGREDLIQSVMRVVRRELPDHPDFLKGLARNALEGCLPQGLFRGQVLSEPDRLEACCDLDQDCLRPLVDAVRVLSLKRRLPPTNTLDRLQVLRESGALEDNLACQAADAFNFIFMLQVRHYLGGPWGASRNSSRLQPSELGSIERRALREAFRVLRRLRRALADAFQIEWERS